jgi:hypothetical protein
VQVAAGSFFRQEHGGQTTRPPFLLLLFPK